jgi:hypothetical protein
MQVQLVLKELMNDFDPKPVYIQALEGEIKFAPYSSTHRITH